MTTIKEARQATGLSQSRAAKYLEIPIRTIQDWEQEKRTPPPYVEKLVIEKLSNAWGVKLLMKDDKFCDCFVEKDKVEFFEHGQWETKRIDKVPYDVCSCCGFKGLVTHGYHEYNYCPFCGAKMDLED